MNTTYTISQPLDQIYDVYSPLVYGIALQISSDKKEAERILKTTFQKISKLELSKQVNPNLGVKLFKLTIEVTCQLFPKYKRENLALKQFRNSPILYHLICENKSIESLCMQTNLTSAQLMKNLHTELTLLSSAKKKYLVRAVTVAA